jgi:hypothetical protein
MLSHVDMMRLQAAEEVVLQLPAGDQRSESAHDLVRGRLYVTDQRIVFQPTWWQRTRGHRLWELPLDQIDKVAHASVPVWVLGVVRFWRHGVRVASCSGSATTFTLSEAHRGDAVTVLERLVAKHRDTGRRDAASAGTG